MNLESFSSIERHIKLKGVYIPGIIHNGSYYYTNIQVLENGVIDAWDLLDLELFAKKINIGWVVPSIPLGETLSIHHLGSWVIDAAEWTFDAQGYYDHVGNMIKLLNPAMINLYDFKGDNTIKEGFVRTQKLKTTQPHPSKTNDEYSWQQVKGDAFSGFIKNDDGSYNLVSINIFADATIRINNLETPIMMPLAQFEQETRDGRFLTNVLPGSKVNILGLGSFTFGEGGSYVDMENKLAEFKDTVVGLNGGRTTSEICWDCFDKYEENPTPELKEKLKIAYENVPEHLRMYLGDMDTKDTLIRQAIYGEEN